MPVAAALDQILAALPRRYPGPGGAVAVLCRGETLVRHAWGWADAERRIPFTPRTLFRMCSVTKHFTCALMLDACPDPAVLDGAVAARLPGLDRAPPAALHLAHNQSGLRDYWAVAMLHGSPAEAPFGDAEAARVIGGTRTLQFAPGTRYSYCNQNFRILSDALEERTGRGFAELLRARIFAPAGMDGAFLAADTRAMPDGTVGHEPMGLGGARAAVNRVFWTGDAGLGAALDDMIAWERWIDATRDDPDGLYNRLSATVRFADGRPAPYGFGLARGTEHGRAVTGHGGALRGWRAHRLHAASDRLSVVVMFNHMSDARAAAGELLAAALGGARCETPPVAPADPALLGAWVEPDTGLAVRADAVDGNAVRLRFGHAVERLLPRPDGGLGNDRTVLRRAADGVWMDRPAENQSTRLLPLDAPAGAAGIAGRYRCAELDAELTVTEGPGDLAYGAFSGFLGRGRMEALEPVGNGVWALPCPRALDHTPPGDWTLRARRDADGRVAGLRVGCWLARGLDYARVGGG